MHCHSGERIRNLANESRMPLCYGGGVKTVEQIEKIISLGVEKVALSSAVIENKHLIKEAVESVGSQSVVIVLDWIFSSVISFFESLNKGSKVLS